MRLKSNTQYSYTPDPGTIEEPVECGVCGEKMKCRRNVNGPRGFAMAMSGSKQLHDSFDCPHREQDWHKQAVALREEARATASAIFQTALEKEADEIVSTRKSTKTIY